MALSDMANGYLDGRDKDAPEPNANRSHSYRHGFMVGRNELKKPFKPLGPFEQVEAWANEALQKDMVA